MIEISFITDQRDGDFIIGVAPSFIQPFGNIGKTLSTCYVIY